MATRSLEEEGEEADGVVDALEREVYTIARAECEEALSALEARGDVTEEHRRAVEQLAEGIADALLAPARESLEEARRRGDADAIRTASELFERESTDGGPVESTQRSTCDPGSSRRRDGGGR